MGETLRHALNMLAELAPCWLREQITPEWFDRYSRRVEEYRLPKGEETRRSYAELIGADGRRLLQVLESETAPAGLRDLPAVETLRQVWEQQYILDEDRLRLRTAAELCRAGLRMDTPYDPEVLIVTHIWLTFETDHTVTPTPVNALGLKGIGEAGTIAAPPAIVNAVVDALAPFGIQHLDMPLSAEKV